MELSGAGTELGSTCGLLSLVAVVSAMPYVTAAGSLATDVVISIPGVLSSSVAVLGYQEESSGVLVPGEAGLFWD